VEYIIENFKSLDVLIKLEEIPAAEIKQYRDFIKTLPKDEQAEWYLELQKHVPYHNQRDNEYKAEVTCNQTSLAMCLEGLGISNTSSEEQFEDYLELLRDENKYGDRIYASTREKEANKLGAQFISLGIVNRDFDKFKNLVLPELKKGNMITFSYGGHIVRLVEIRDNGIVVNDPYGCLSCKKDLLQRQKLEKNTFCNNLRKANCCNHTKALVFPCCTNNTDNSNLPGKNCFWLKESVDVLKLYNIYSVQP